VGTVSYMRLRTPRGEESLRTVAQSSTWSRRAAEWDHSAVPGLERVAESVMRRAGPLCGREVLDLGSGSGQLTLDAALAAEKVVAVDFSPDMLDLLEERAAARGCHNVDTILSSLQTLDLPDRSVDVIVSNYALHHLRHDEKMALLRRTARWLRPGGTIAIGDMMFGLTGDPVGRRVVASKLGVLAKRGPAGWWRIAKNAWRLVVVRHECPESVGAWTAMLESAGYADVRSERVVSEAAVVCATLPHR
jgi:SAM-dependent methyltransferase